MDITVFRVHPPIIRLCGAVKGHRHWLHYATAKLKVNEANSAVARPVERKFLGFSFTTREVKWRSAAKAWLPLSYLECGGQRRDRTADAGLFRAALYH